MANPFVVAAALRNAQITLTCPHCGHKKIVPRKPATFRVCPRCKKQFADPLSKRPRK